MSEKNYRELWLKKIRFFSNITFGIIGLCSTFIVLEIGVLLYYAHITHGNNFTIYIVLFVLLFFVVTGVAMKYFYKSYVQIINQLTYGDLATLERIGESRWWIEKYLPSFIIYSGKITIFKLFRQTTLYFTEINEISIRPNYFSRGGQNKLVIFKKSGGGSYFFGMDSNPIQLEHLLDKAVEYNPNIMIKRK